MRYCIALFSLLFLFSCKNNEDKVAAEDAIDAGRIFIESSLQGKFNKANQYMLQDEENQYWLGKVSQNYNQMSEQEKAAYSKASINIIEVSDVVADSITIIQYSNSYKKSPQKVKVIKHNGEWMVDFKYTFSGNL